MDEVAAFEGPDPESASLCALKRSKQLVPNKGLFHASARIFNFYDSISAPNTQSQRYLPVPADCIEGIIDKMQDYRLQPFLICNDG
jgi:hypothetical protein